ncbi:MAG: TerC family protein [Deltaproteobacteria bacterium]|nr:TerC family protein [Deltaproteobacteria bacterium]
MFEQYLPWIGFHVFILIALAIDLGVFHRDAHAVKVREALTWSGIWLSMALLFNAGIFYFRGKEPALEFLAGYLIEWSLSIDNLFVFLTIFSAFSVPQKFQHRVLFWGILGALAMRAIFIFAGLTLLSHFHWLIYVFGAFLLLTGIKLALVEKKEEDPRNHWLVRLAKRWLPFTDALHDGKFLIRQNQRLLGTPLLLVLLIVEATDLIFAADSIPAILAITNDPFIVYTSNVFAILGLRSLYFALAGMMSAFRYLRYGLAGVLVFVGAKLCLTNIYKIPITASLMVIASLLGVAIACSILIEDTKGREAKQ